MLPARYDLETALSELTESATAVLGLSGSGVTMAAPAATSAATGIHFLTAYVAGV